jgi:hypothetical protein
LLDQKALLYVFVEVLWLAPFLLPSSARLSLSDCVFARMALHAVLTFLSGAALQTSSLGMSFDGGEQAESHGIRSFESGKSDGVSAPSMPVHSRTKRLAAAVGLGPSVDKLMIESLRQQLAEGKPYILPLSAR